MQDNEMFRTEGKRGGQTTFERYGREHYVNARKKGLKIKVARDGVVAAAIALTTERDANQYTTRINELHAAVRNYLDVREA